MRNSYSRGPRVRECLTYFHADFGTFAFVKVFQVNFIDCSCKIPRHHGIFAINVFSLILFNYTIDPTLGSGIDKD